MTDLIERLRNHLEYGYEGAMGDSLPSAICQEAADEIERLRDRIARAMVEDAEQKAEIERLQELTKNDGKEIGSYREGTGLRGENRKLEAEIEQLTEQLDWHQQESVLRDMAIDAQKAEIERLNCALTISRGKHENAIREIERLQAVVDAVKDIKWRSIDKDNMEFATTCFVVDRIREAIAAGEDK